MKTYCTFQKNELTLSKGMPYFFNIDGEISVILCRRKASHTLKLLGKKPDKKHRQRKRFWSVNGSQQKL